MNTEFIENLKQLARKQTTDEAIDESGGLDSYLDFCGGNYDEALYFIGGADGRIELAREVLKQLGIKYEQET